MSARDEHGGGRLGEASVLQVEDEHGVGCLGEASVLQVEGAADADVTFAAFAIADDDSVESSDGSPLESQRHSFSLV